MQKFCRVAVDSPVPALDRPFDYAIPERMLGRVKVGSVVRVILHGRNMRAFVTDLLDSPAVTEPRPIRSLVASDPVFARSEVELASWIARRYVVPLGLVLHDAVPGRYSAPSDDDGRDAPPAPRSQAPSGVGRAISDVISKKRSACVLPRSLRDEEQLAAHVAGETSAAGGRTLIICPRVEQAEALAVRIPGALVLHGAERPADRAAAWAAARDGRGQVLVGVRSALLVPMEGLGTVCVMSAHDRSLKSERAPRLHALVVAQERARVNGAAFIASSPAPPVELAAENSVDWVEGSRSVVRPEIARPSPTPVTPRLVDVVRSSVGDGADALVFVARRGNTLRLSCEDCGWRPRCEQCGSGLAQGGLPGRLVCRVCGEEAPAPSRCPSCGGALAEKGWGHERVARALERSGLGVPIVRVTRGTVPSDRPKPAVIVGTLAAAHTTDAVGAVCVADLDQLLARPDFRAGERALQTLHDLAAVLRDGGRFLVQTREADHHAVQAFTRRSYRFFLDRELSFRKQTGYPPFGVVIRVETSDGSLEELRRRVIAAGGDMIGAIQRRGRATALIRATALEPLLDPLRHFAAAHSRTRIDVDPVDVI